MNTGTVTKATLGRLPGYLDYLQKIQADRSSISATGIAKALGLGEVQVRKDLGAVSGQGKPKVGYNTVELTQSLENYLGTNCRRKAVIVGAGKLGKALLDYDGFEEYGLEVTAAFDKKMSESYFFDSGKPVHPMNKFNEYCRNNYIKLGIITVPKEAAQDVCDMMVKNHISAIWSFAPGVLQVPDGVYLRQENLALSFAHLNQQL
jgi:redox-sensing transcriptional repressor